MIDVLDIVISNQEAVSKELDIIYSSNMKQYRARFTFSDNSWDGYDKIVIFDRVKNYDTPIGLIVKDKASELVEIVNDREFYCIIPWEILVQPGYFTISLYGTITDGEPKKKTIVINNKFTIQNSGNTTVYPRIPTPNVYEQLLSIIDTEDIKEDLESLEKELEIFEENIDKKIDDLDKKIEEQPTSYVGKITENGGEIFNDYENNKALAQYSSASGYGTNSVGIAQTVVGQFNSLNGESYFIVGNGTDNNNRSTAFKVNHDGSAEIQTSGTNDLNVVNYKQLKDYVAVNGKSPWDSQSEMLFKTGDLKITNNIAGTESRGSIKIGEEYAINSGQSYTILSNNGLDIYNLVSQGKGYLTHSHLSLNSGSKTLYPPPTISLRHGNDVEDVNELEVDTYGINCQESNSSINISASWKDIIDSVSVTNLLTNGDVKITNHIESDDESNGSIAIGKYSAGQTGQSWTKLNCDGLYIENIAGNDHSYLYSHYLSITAGSSTSQVPEIYLINHHHLDDASDELIVDTNGITYNSKSISWDRLFAAIEKIENTVDVSTEGQ